MQNTAFKIRELRKNRNLTQEYLADRLSMSVKTYQRLESGKIALTLQQGLTLAQELDTALEEFFPEIKPALQMPAPPSSLQAEIGNLQNLLQAAREERRILLRIIDRLTEEQGKGKEY